MWHSIQENLKKINSRLSTLDAVSVAITAFVIVCLMLYLHRKQELSKTEVVYSHGEVLGEAATTDERPFASKNGATYTYLWCQGADKILEKNKVFFENAEFAERSGRTLSKLCNR